MSGAFKHFLAVSKDGHLFGRGSNECGRPHSLNTKSRKLELDIIIHFFELNFPQRGTKLK